MVQIYIYHYYQPWVSKILFFKYLQVAVEFYRNLYCIWRPCSILQNFLAIISTICFKTNKILFRIKLQYYVSDETVSERVHRFFLRNASSSAFVRIFFLCLRFLLVVLYFARAALDTPKDEFKKFATCYTYLW